MSRRKQAIQKPILGGLPQNCNSIATVPMAAPARMIPHFVAKMFVKAPLNPLLNEEEEPADLLSFIIFMCVFVLYSD
jgi:hypothetical protein